MSELSTAFLQQLIDNGNTVIIVQGREESLEDSLRYRLLKKKKRLGVSSVPAPTPG